VKFISVTHHAKDNGDRRKAPSLFLVLAVSGFTFPAFVFAGVGKTASDVCANSTDAAFRAKYCSAAKDLKRGYAANQATSAVWTAASVTCGVACGKAIGALICKGATIGGSAGEGVITKKFTDSLIGEGTKMGTEALTGSGKAAAETSTELTDSGGVNTDACIAAGTTALKAYSKFSDSKQNEKSLTQLRDQTKDMNTAGQNVSIFSPGDTQNSGVKDGQNTAAASFGSQETCDEAKIRTALGAIRCAASADPSLPAYLKSEEFLQDLQKATGKSPDAFFSGFESPAKSIFDSPVVTGLSEDQQRDLADSLSGMEGYTERKSAQLASARGTQSDESAPSRPSRISDNDTGFDMNGMIAGVLGQMGGAADGENGTPHFNGDLAAGRAPAAAHINSENRKISIFDRVKWRYGAVTARDHLGAQ
jgi:hypothetical protein